MPLPPSPPECIRHYHRNIRPSAIRPRYLSPNPPRRRVRILRQQANHIIPRHIRGVNPRVGAHKPMPSFGYDNPPIRIHPNHRPALPQHQLHQPRILARRLSEMPRQRRRPHAAQIHQPTLRLRHNLLRNHHNIPVQQRSPLPSRRSRNHPPKPLAAHHLRQPGHPNNLYARYLTHCTLSLPINHPPNPPIAPPTQKFLPTFSKK